MKILFPYLAKWDSANRSRYHQLLTQLCLIGHQVFVLKAPNMALGDISFAEMNNSLSEIKNLTISEFEAPQALRRFMQMPLPKSKLLKKGLLSLSSVDQVRRFTVEEEIDLLLVYNLPQVRLLENVECHKHFDMADDLIAMLGYESGFAGKAGVLAAAQYTQNRMLEMADSITVASSVLKDQIETTTHLLPNGADLTALDQSVATPWITEKPGPWVGFVGAFEYWVDFELMLRVARRMRHINFLIVGGGRLFPQIKQTVEEGNFQNVHLTGALPYDEAMNCMAAMNICLVPFTRDAVSDGSSPLKLFEYAALRKPIICTPIDEVKRMGQGWVSFGEDAADFAHVIDDLLGNPNKAQNLAATGRSQVEKYFNWPVIAQQFLKVVMKKSRIAIPSI